MIWCSVNTDNKYLCISPMLLPNGTLSPTVEQGP